MRWGDYKAHLKKCIEENRIPDDEPCVIKFPRQEAKRKMKNKPDAEGHRRTRIAWNCGDADTFAEFHKERERYVQVCGENPTLATDMMIIVLKLHPDEEIKRYMEALESVNRSAQHP